MSRRVGVVHTRRGSPFVIPSHRTSAARNLPKQREGERCQIPRSARDDMGRKHQSAPPYTPCRSLQSARSLKTPNQFCFAGVL